MMATDKTPQPLQNRMAIVNPDGTPTDYFIRWAQERQKAILDTTDADQVQAIAEDVLAARKLIGGTGIDVNSGPEAFLSGDVTIDAKIQELLDVISSTRGSVLYRGNTAWAALAPGTAGQVLSTNGAGADPSWIAAGGGGGGSLTVYFNQDNSVASTGTTPTTPTDVISVTIPASGAARTFMVNGNIVWGSGGHGMRGLVRRDTTSVWPTPAREINPILAGDGEAHLVFSGVLVAVPGDGASHTISLAWNSQTSTSALTLINRQITAIQIA